MVKREVGVGWWASHGLNCSLQCISNSDLGEIQLEQRGTWEDEGSEGSGSGQVGKSDRLLFFF